MSLLSWEKDRLSSSYDLFLDSKLAGQIRNKSVSITYHIQFKRKKYLFDSEGLIRQKILLIDIGKQKSIGEIQFTIWGTKAKVTLFDKSYTWKVGNIFYTRWSIFSESKRALIYSKAYRKDSQEVSNKVEELLILCGIVCMSKVRQFGI